MVRPHEAVHQLDAFIAAKRHQRLSLSGRRAQRLFAQDMFASICTEHYLPSMMLDRRGNVNRFDV